MENDYGRMDWHRTGDDHDHVVQPANQIKEIYVRVINDPLGQTYSPPVVIT